MLNLARQEKRPPKSLPGEVLAWLSRGALEQITSFCARALDPTWALDIAIYEYELKEIRDAIDAARHLGADVRIVYHAAKDDVSPRSKNPGVPAPVVDPEWPHGALAPDDRWAKPYLQGGTLECADRERFAAPV
ncbi:MAG TPA: hypothetical protein VNA28_11415 [Solirubrobacteraceae bacterium]|nr:hypothetical protein [Solirubrobacteraceae bacterium]